MMQHEMIQQAMDHVIRYEWDANAWLYLYCMATTDNDRPHIYSREWYQHLVAQAIE